LENWAIVEKHVMIFHERFLPGLAVASYLVGDERARECAVIDPTREVQDFLKLAKREGLHIRHILETHVHSDFVSGAAELKECLGDSALVHCSGLGGTKWIPPYADVTVSDGDETRIGSIRLRAIHTPGHTPEHITWAVFDETRSKETPWLLLTGDFLFAGGVGGPDSLDEQEHEVLFHQLYQSVFERLPGFPDFTEIHSGHGARSHFGKASGTRTASTLGYERRFNPALAKTGESEWVGKILTDMPAAPSYFQRIKKLNASGPAIVGSRRPGRQAFSVKQLQEHISQNPIVLDVRRKEAFATAHIPGAINIPLCRMLSVWAARVLDYDRPIFIVLEDPRDLDEVVTHLLRVGFDDVRGYLEGGLAEWESGALKFGCLATIDVEQLDDQLTGVGHWVPFVLDVRTDSEWEAGHIDGAHHIECGRLKERLSEVPENRPVAVICSSGERSTIAASFLQAQGHREISHVLGGMSAWNSRTRDA
jgi:hydroxyacylglutathione hydrolase